MHVKIFFYALTKRILFLSSVIGDEAPTGRDMPQGIRVRLPGSRIGGDEGFRGGNIFLTGIALWCYQERDSILSLLFWINGPKQENVVNETTIYIAHQIKKLFPI